MDPIVLIVIIVGAVMTAAFAALYWNALRRAGQARDWPTADGEILSSELVEAKAGDGSYETRNYRMYGVNVTYAYSVGGQALHGKRIRAGYTNTYNHAEADADFRKYPAGAKVTVRYNPQDHPDSVLEIGRPSSYLKTMLGIGIGFLVLGGLLSLM